VETLDITHQCVPLLYVIESINTNVKASCEDENLNPIQKTRLEELVYGLVDFLNTMVTIRNFCKMLCPEVACIFQGIPNVGGPGCGKILDLTEDSIVIQVTDISLQPVLHHIEA